MTFEELLELDLDKLERMSDAEIVEILGPYIPHARPDENRPRTTTTVTKPVKKGKMSVQKALEILNSLG